MELVDEHLALIGLGGLGWPSLNKLQEYPVVVPFYLYYDLPQTLLLLIFLHEAPIFNPSTILQNLIPIIQAHI